MVDLIGEEIFHRGVMKKIDLKSFQWKKRLLLIYSPGGADERLRKQTALIIAEKAGFAERDLVVFVIPASSFSVVLIGKDGTEKLRQQSVLEPEKLFRLVDSMPMRQAGGR